MMGLILWLIGYLFTDGYEDDREVSKSFLWKIILFLVWPIRLGELFREDFVDNKEV